FGPAGFRCTQLDEGPKQHSQLVHAKLRVACEIGGFRLRRARLEVHDNSPAIGVALQPVYLTCDLNVVDPDPQFLLDGDQLARVSPVPFDEPRDHLAGVLALPGAVPHAAEVKLMPDLVDPAGDVSLIGALGAGRSRRGDHGPEMTGD